MVKKGQNIVHVVCEQPLTTLELKVLYNIIVFSKYLGKELSFEGSNIFVRVLEVGVLALWIKKSIFAFIPRSTDNAYNEEILSHGKNAHVWSSKKSTTRCPTTMFNPSKERSWSEFLN